jgi:hypothetical protein
LLSPAAAASGSGQSAAGLLCQQAMRPRCSAAGWSL